MSKQQKTANPSNNPADSATAFSAWPQMSTLGIDSAMQANAQLFETVVKINTEMANFLGHRLSEDAALTGRLVASHSPVEMAQIYSEFMTESSQDYLQEVQKVSTLFTEALSQLPTSYATPPTAADAE